LRAMATEAGFNSVRIVIRKAQHHVILFSRWVVHLCL
jgi:hypothetical protein